MVEMIGELDRDNERLRTKLLEFMTLMEEAVTAQVAAERRVLELEADLQAIRSTKTMRMLATVSQRYAWLRSTVEIETVAVEAWRSCLSSIRCSSRFAIVSHRCGC